MERRKENQSGKLDNEMRFISKEIEKLFVEVLWACNDTFFSPSTHLVDVFVKEETIDNQYLYLTTLRVDNTLAGVVEEFKYKGGRSMTD